MTKSFITKTRWLVTIILLLSLSIPNAWGAVGSSITAHGNIADATVYYLSGKATVSGSTKTYYCVLASDATGNVRGNGNTTQANGTKFTFLIEGSTYYLVSPNGYYVEPAASNGYLTLTTEAKAVTVSTQSSLIRITGTTNTGRSIQKSKSSANYLASYANTQNDLTLYVAGYRVIYDKNGATGGAVPTDATVYGDNATATIKANTGSLVKTGYTFAGWNTAANGSGTDVAATGSATRTITAGLRLYAKWTAAASCTTNATVSAGSLKGSVSSSSEATAQCTGGITNLGGAGCSITSYGFAVGTSTNPTIGGTLTGTGKTYQVGTTYTTTSTAFEKLIDGLSASTKYHVRPYATNGNGTAYGTEFNFTTLAACTAAPTVTAGSTGTVTSTTAVVNCSSGLSALGTGGCTVISYGFVYGTSENPTTSNSTNEVGTSYTTTGTSFNTTLTSLTEGQLYYVRPYATNGYETGYGTQTSFGTPKITTSLSTRNFGDHKVNGGPYTMTFKVSGVYLQSDISIAKSGTNQAMFSIDKATISQTDGTAAETTITVSYSPTAAGSHSATLTLTSTNATSKTVTLSGTGKWEVTWDVSGSSPTTTLVANSTKPTLPDPAGITSCDGTSTTFIGWTKAPWVGKQNQTYIDGLTGDDVVHTDNTTMSNVTANGTTYYAVFAQATTTSTSKDYTFEITTADFPGSGYAANDGDHNSTATASDASTQTVTWTSSNVCEQSGSIQFKKSSGCLYNGTSYGTIKSVTITSGSNLSHFENSSAQPTGSGTPKNFFQVKAGSSTGTCSKITVVYTVSSSTTTYSNYLTTCCNMPTLAFGASPYAVIRQDIQGASTTTWAEVDVTFTSNNTTGTISATTYTDSKTVYKMGSWQSRSTTDVSSLCATNHAYFEVLTQPSGATPGTGKFHVKTTSGQTGQGTYRIAITQASTDEDHGNFCEKTVYGFVDVTLRDKFVDKLNDNGTVNKDGHGAQLATPILSELGTQVENACHSEGRKLKGWIKETDLKSKYETGNSERVQTIDGLCETCDDATDWTSLIVAPGTNVTMSGATWYAVWAYER